MPLPLLMLQITFCQMSADQSWKITNWLIKRGYLLLKICHRWSQPDFNSITIQFILTCKELWQVICYCDYLVDSRESSNWNPFHPFGRDLQECLFCILSNSLSQDVRVDSFWTFFMNEHFYNKILLFWEKKWYQVSKNEFCLIIRKFL